jgi:hypothetical protein
MDAGGRLYGWHGFARSWLEGKLQGWHAHVRGVPEAIRLFASQLKSQCAELIRKLEDDRSASEVVLGDSVSPGSNSVIDKDIYISDCDVDVVCKQCIRSGQATSLCPLRVETGDLGCLEINGLPSRWACPKYNDVWWRAICVPVKASARLRYDRG